MALIKCIECKNTISSLATSCPFCGCPVEYQKLDETTEKTPQTDRIFNMDRWLNVVQMIECSKVIPAIEEIQSLIATKSLVPTMDIYDEIKSTGNVPVDHIIEKFPELEIKPTTKPCSACGRTISVKAESCPHCGEPTGVHVCPKCGSTDVVYIDAVSKVASMALFGAFSVNTVRNKYECTKCKMKF